jgi:hypothetical protein
MGGGDQKNDIIEQHQSAVKYPLKISKSARIFHGILLPFFHGTLLPFFHGVFATVF